LFAVIRVVVLDPESELVASDVLVPENRSVMSHFRPELESDIICKWLLWVDESLQVDLPCLAYVV
jgi:hypothetical protein